MFISQSGEGVLIVDAGGGTVDLSAYRMTETQNCFEEIARGSCAHPTISYIHALSLVCRSFSGIRVCQSEGPHIPVR
jgi:hypothetical protein